MKAGKPLLGGDHDRRFFEASWMFKRGGTYYFTYSTGDTHFIAYATGDTAPYGPFRYRRARSCSRSRAGRRIIRFVKVGDTWQLFYHDTQLSNRNHLRSTKVTELTFNP